MKNKKTLKVLALALAFVLVAGIAVGATMAYLTSTDSVKNVFTVGKVEITLDETVTNEYGAATTDPATRNNNGNEYKLIPGHTYTKDPTVHVEKTSEPCYVYVKVENGISTLEPTGTDANTIAKQIATTYGWEALSGVANVYYKEVSAEDLAGVASDKTYLDLKVFDTFTLADNAVLSSVVTSGDNRTNITITAYAIQKDGFDTASAAWTASGFGSTT